MEENTHRVGDITLYSFQKDKNAIEMQNMYICAGHREGAVTDRMCQRWFAKFRAGHSSLDDAPRPGRPVDVDSDLIETFTENTQHSTMWETADVLKISRSIKLLVTPKHASSVLWERLITPFGQRGVSVRRPNTDLSLLPHRLDKVKGTVLRTGAQCAAGMRHTGDAVMEKTGPTCVPSMLTVPGGGRPRPGSAARTQGCPDGGCKALGGPRSMCGAGLTPLRARLTAQLRGRGSEASPGSLVPQGRSLLQAAAGQN